MWFSIKLTRLITIERDLLPLREKLENGEGQRRGSRKGVPEKAGILGTGPDNLMA